jgi:hypothetical protein
MSEIDREVWLQEQKAIKEVQAKPCRECCKCRVFSENGIEIGFCLECEEFLSGIELDASIYDMCGSEPFD